MERDSFTAKRRAARSSTHFRLALALSLLFCLLVAWDSRRFVLTTRVASPPQPAGAFILHHHHHDNNQAVDQLVLTPADDAMARRSASLPLRIVSYNIRYATRTQAGDEKPWKVRCPKVCTQMRFITAGRENAFLCLQEALHAQIHDVQAGLGPDWAWVGRGRGTGEADGEFSPIFYRSDTWKCIRSQTRWLSSTPDKPSRGWDAAMNRIVTMADFVHNDTGARVVVLNTHFDHVGTRARLESAKLLIGFARDWAAAPDKSPPQAVLVAGDLNSEHQDEAYRVLTGPQSGLSDIARIIPKDEHYGNELTYTSFREPNESPLLIDFLFIREPRTADVKTYGVLANSFDDGFLLSDHRPVVADLDLDCSQCRGTDGAEGA